MISGCRCSKLKTRSVKSIDLSFLIPLNRYQLLFLVVLVFVVAISRKQTVLVVVSLQHHSVSDAVARVAGGCEKFTQGSCVPLESNDADSAGFLAPAVSLVLFRDRYDVSLTDCTVRLCCFSVKLCTCQRSADRYIADDKSATTASTSFCSD